MSILYHAGSIQRFQFMSYSIHLTVFVYLITILAKIVQIELTPEFVTVPLNYHCLLFLLLHTKWTDILKLFIYLVLVLQLSKVPVPLQRWRLGLEMNNYLLFVKSQ